MPLPGAVEIPALRKRDSKHYWLPDNRVAVEFGKNLHYARDGRWLDLDLSLNPLPGNVWKVRGSQIYIDADGGGLSVFHGPSGKGIRFLFPRPPDRVDGRSAYWTTAAGVEWRFTLGRLGLKTEARISAKRGPRTYSFDGQMLGGLAPPNPDAAGNLVQPAGHFTIPRSWVRGADGERYTCGPWTRVGGTISFDFDDTALPAAALPYVIDPTTTFAVAASSDDGIVFADDSVYPPAADGWNDNAGNDWFVRRSFFGGTTYSTINSYFRWDTSAIPDNAIIDDVAFEIKTESGPSDANARSVGLQWNHSWHPLAAADYVATPTANAHAGILLSTFTDETVIRWNDLLDAPNQINKSGYTGLMAFVTGGVPTGENSTSIYYNDHATEPEPKLIVTYGAAASPGPGTPGQYYQSFVPKGWF